MNLTSIDWAIIVGMLTFMTVMAIISNRYTKSVSDYLTAGRSGGRYMMTMASGMVWLGAINVVAMFELYHSAGFNAMWWIMLTTPLFVYLNISGFGVYRFRETRALTIAQFLETRYSKEVRVLAGILAWVAGLINFGLFPAVGARFFMAFCALPASFECLGMACPTFPVVMIIMLGISLFFVFAGGHVAVLVTDCLQGMFTQIAAVIIIITLFVMKIDWSKIVDVLITKGDPVVGKSLLDPLHASNQSGGFTFWFFIIGIIGAWYTIMSNMQIQASIASAKTAHEFRMGSALNQWRWQSLLLFFMVLTLCAMVVLYHPDHASTAQQIDLQLDKMVASQPNEMAREALRGQLTITAALSHVLPVGLTGLFCAIMVAALISTYDSFMHTWGSVFLQDVVMPFRKKRYTTKKHLRLLRISIFAVAVFSFIFSLLFPNPENILMYFALVNNIWLGGSGAVILGGLYWKRGTTTSAIWTLIFGAVLGTAGSVVTLGWPSWVGGKFPINPQWLFCLTILASTAFYWVVSVMGKEVFDMDKLLHRGKYAIEEDQTHVDIPTRWYEKIFGITREFNRFDRFLAYAIVGWFLMWLGVFVIGMIYGVVAKPEETAWAKFWHVYLFILFVIALFTTVLFTVGGFKDLMHLFKVLKTQVRDFDDDGTVESRENGDRHE
jgi:SSS family solute:Na+ symporter